MYHPYDINFFLLIKWKVQKVLDVDCEPKLVVTDISCNQKLEFFLLGSEYQL